MVLSGVERAQLLLGCCSYWQSGNGLVRGGKQTAVDAATADRVGMVVSGVESRQLLMHLQLTEEEMVVSGVEAGSCWCSYRWQNREWWCQGWKQAAVDAATFDREAMVVSGVGNRQLLMERVNGSVRGGSKQLLMQLQLTEEGMVVQGWEAGSCCCRY